MGSLHSHPYFHHWLHAAFYGSWTSSLVNAAKVSWSLKQPDKSTPLKQWHLQEPLVVTETNKGILYLLTVKPEKGKSSCFLLNIFSPFKGQATLPSHTQILVPGSKGWHQLMKDDILATLPLKRLMVRWPFSNRLYTSSSVSLFLSPERQVSRRNDLSEPALDQTLGMETGDVQISSDCWLPPQKLSHWPGQFI